MKKTILTILFVIIGALPLLSQGLRRPNQPRLILDPAPGFITINEINVGLGLGGVTTPFSKSFFGFTTVNGYQVDESFMAGAGTGIFVYEDGIMIPLFVDLRIRIMVDQLTPYLSGSAGLLLNPSDINSGTRLFINPSVGVRYTKSRRLGANMSLGFHMQMGSNTGRASFLNLRTGVVYKF